MKKTVLFSALFCLLGLVAGGCLLLAVLTQGWLPNTRVTITTGKSSSSVSTIVTTSVPAEFNMPDLTDHAVILDRALEIAGYLRDRDWSSLAGTVHPELGVTFTPYSTVSENDLNFTAADVADFAGNQSSYLWGYTDGSGLPLSLTPEDYVKDYVFNADYTLAHCIGINYVFSSGNSLENVADAYPDATFVEFYYSGLDESNEGFDWCGLKLVFEPFGGHLMLVGIIHSQWTI